MLPFFESLGYWALATLLPALAGISLLVLIGGLTSPRYSAALGLGIFFWFFVDTIQGSSNLLVNAGFSGGTDQVGLVLLFVVGVVAFLAADGKLFSDSGGGLGPSIPLLVALAAGIHGLGEGSAFGSTASQTTSASVLTAFGGVSQGVAYALHKVFEPLMVAAVYVPLSKAVPRSAKRSLLEVFALALTFTVPSLVGAATGYFVSYDATYLFALGAGSSVYAGMRLARQVFAGSAAGRGESLRVAVAVVLGFILIYLAALVHA